MEKKDFVAISLGAGVQSSVMLLMADRGLILPRPDVAVFADTGWEPELIYDHLDWLKSEVSIPVEVVTNKGRNLYDDTWNGVNATDGLMTTIPVFATDGRKSVTLSQRQCTKNYKVIPIRQTVRREMDVAGLRTVSQWIGISLDEVVRMKDSGVQYVTHRWPLVEMRMTRLDCLAWFKGKLPRSAIGS